MRIARATFLALSFLICLAQELAGQRPGPPPPLPPRDVRPIAQTGTASIRGRVTAADTTRPLRRARVILSAPELGPDNRVTSTGPDGQYEFTELPGGRYTVRVTRSGYLGLQYGQRRPLEAGKPVQVEASQSVVNVDFALPRSSNISGQITDESGDPVAQDIVTAMRTAYWQGKRRLVSAGSVTPTDDDGEYRITNLPPGTYVVMAALRDTWRINENGVEHVMGYARTYFPGTTADQARPVAVGLAQRISNINFSLLPGRAVSISGTAYNSLGQPIAGRVVSLTQDLGGPAGALVQIIGNATTATDGTFRIRDVAPGEYKLRVQTTTEKQTATDTIQVQETALLPLNVDSTELMNLTLMTTAGATFSGQVVTESGAVPTGPVSRFAVTMHLVDGDLAGPAPPPPGVPPPPGFVVNVDNGRVKLDGTFALTGVTGAAYIRVTAPDGWMVRSIQREGADISDIPVEGKSGETIGGIQVIVTEKVTVLTGQIVDTKNAPVSDGTVVVFAKDPTKWTEDSRWIRAVRPTPQGQFEVKGLPSGDYFIVAREYVEDGIWNDADFLSSMRDVADSITLRDGESRAISLRLQPSRF
jgi:hypothetical protein